MLRPRVSTGKYLKHLHNIRHFSKICFSVDRLSIGGPLDLFNPPKVVGKFIAGVPNNYALLVEFIVHVSHPSCCPTARTTALQPTELAQAIGTVTDRAGGIRFSRLLGHWADIILKLRRLLNCSVSLLAATSPAGIRLRQGRRSRPRA